MSETTEPEKTEEVEEETKLCERSSLEILPQEIWEKIFDKVTDSHDWLSLYRTSSKFEVVQADKRTLTLFSGILPLIENWLPKKELLRCRLVCRKWKKLMEEYDTFKLETIDLGDHSRDPFFFQKLNMFTSSNINDMSRFLRDMKHHPGNPFVGRAVALMFPHLRSLGPSRMEDYWAKSIEMLEKFGKHIRFLAICSYYENADNLPEMKRTYGRIAFALKLLPHLEGLSLINYLKTKINQGVPEMRTYLRQHPMPRLPNLRILSVVETSDESIILEALLKQSCSPQKLTQALLMHVPSGTAKQFPKLVSVLASFDRCDMPELRQCTWPLTSLCLMTPGNDIKKTFQIIEKFAPTLTKLIFNFSLKATPDLKLTLPNLILFDVMEMEGNFEFLYGNKKVDRINIMFFKPSEQAYYFDDREMYRQDLWVKLPKLKVFRYKTIFKQRVLLRGAYHWYRYRYSGYPETEMEMERKKLKIKNKN